MSARHLLASNRAFRAYWAARLVSFTGDQFARTALLVEAHDEGGAAGVGLLLLAFTLPRFLGPLTGALADRVDGRRLMAACELTQGALYALLALTQPPLPAVLAIVALATATSTAFTPAGRSALPAFVARDELQRANALLATGLNAGLALGPALGGLLTSVAGVRAALAFDATTFAASALLIATLPPLPPASGERGPESYLSTLRAGLAVLRAHAVARAVAIGLLVSVTFASLDNVALVFLARDVLDASAFAFGLMTSAYGLGMVAAPLLLASATRRVAPQSVLYGGLALDGAGTLATGLVPNVATGLATQGVGGAGNGLENVATDTLLQLTVPKERLGTVFGTVYTAPFVAEAIAYSAGGVLLEAIGARAVFVVAGAGVIAALALVRLLLGDAVKYNPALRGD